MSERSARPVLLALAALWTLARLATGATVATIDRPYPGDGVAPPVATLIEVPEGASAARVAEILADAGLVESADRFRWYLRLSGRAGEVKAGEYRFEPPASMRQIADLLVEGRVVLVPMTVPEGSSVWEVTAAIERAGFGDREAARAALERPELIADLDPEADDLEGYLFPDTYLAPSSTDPAEIVEMMIARFREIWSSERRARAEELGMSVREVVTLASLVEAETASAGERVLVSAVFHNRLDRGMLLQCDPTLLYALRLDGRTDRNIRRSDFDHDSPYNTYRYPGLPAGPIGNPGAASIDAALHPAEVDYLYFVGRNDGTHAFARTLREHNANVDRYQRSR